MLFFTVCAILIHPIKHQTMDVEFSFYHFLVQFVFFYDLMHETQSIYASTQFILHVSESWSHNITFSDLFMVTRFVASACESH